MSVLIRGMEMPKNCNECRFHVDGWCYVLRPESEEERKRITTNYCPLVEIPPHGRLIDADAFIAEQRRLYCKDCDRRKGMKNGKVKFVYDIGDAPCRVCGFGAILDDLEDAPTIIEAEDGST